MGSIFKDTASEQNAPANTFKVEEKKFEPYSAENARLISEGVKTVEEVFGIMKDAYPHLTEESTENVSTAKKHLKTLLAQTTQILNSSDLETRNRYLDDIKPNDYYKASYFIEAILTEYQENVARMENIAQKVENEPTGVAKTIITNASKVLSKNTNGYGLFLDGGTSHLAQKGFYDEKPFEYETDLDFVADCEETDIEAIYKELKTSFLDNPDIEVEIKKGYLTSISVVEKGSGFKLASIVSAEKFAEGIRQVIPEDTQTEASNIEIMLKHWPTQTRSQVAIHYKPNGETAIVNAGKPLLNSNLYEDNANCIKTPEIQKDLLDQGRIQEAIWIRNEMLNELTRVYKSAEKGYQIGYPESDEEKAGVEEIALAQFLKLDPQNEKDAEVIARIQERALAYLARSLQTRNNTLWSDLPAIPLEALASRALFDASGFEIEIKDGMEYVPTGVNMPKEAKLNTAVYMLITGDLAKELDIEQTLYWKGKKTGLHWVENYAEEDYCESPTEYFCLKTAIANPTEQELIEISEELSKSLDNANINSVLRKKSISKYPSEISTEFSKDLFITWTKELQAIFENNPRVRDLCQKALNSGQTIEEFKSEFHDDVIKLIKEIKESSFWQSKNK